MPVPILLACFNRPNKLRQALMPLQGVANPIFVVLDGPRDLEDKVKIDLVLETITQSKVEIQEILSFAENKGTNAVALGIDWILEDFDSVIIVEEDIVISKEFIHFSEEMLRRYRDDFSIGSISAMNSVPISEISNVNEPYRFSCYFYAWGWSTWKSRWEKMIDPSEWELDSLLPPKTARNPITASKWKAAMREVESGRAPGLWDYKWIYTFWTNGWLSVVPNRNLSLNIGFDAEASHTLVAPTWAPKSLETLEDYDLILPKVEQDLKADKWSSKYVHNAFWWTILKTRIKSNLLFQNARSR